MSSLTGEQKLTRGIRLTARAKKITLSVWLCADFVPCINYIFYYFVRTLQKAFSGVCTVHTVAFIARHDFNVWPCSFQYLEDKTTGLGGCAIAEPCFAKRV